MESAIQEIIEEQEEQKVVTINLTIRASNQRREREAPTRTPGLFDQFSGIHRNDHDENPCDKTFATDPGQKKKHKQAKGGVPDQVIDDCDVTLDINE